jgi:phage gp16-like protein
MSVSHCSAGQFYIQLNGDFMGSRVPKKSATQRLRAQVHIAKKETALDDDTYRALLKGATGKTSTKGMDLFELSATVQAFKDRGWKPRGNYKSRQRTSRASSHKDPRAKSPADKIRALWITMHREDIVNDGSDFALQQYCLKRVGQRYPDWMTPDQSKSTIESLKQWRKRVLVQRGAAQ